MASVLPPMNSESRKTVDEEICEAAVRAERQRCFCKIEALAMEWDKSGEAIPQGSDPVKGVSRVARFQIADALRAAAISLLE